MAPNIKEYRSILKLSFSFSEHASVTSQYLADAPRDNDVSCTSLDIKKRMISEITNTMEFVVAP